MERRRSRSMARSARIICPTLGPVKLSLATPETEIIRFMKSLKNESPRRVYFFTFKDNSQKFIGTDKPRNWLRKFSNKYCVVRSPVGGWHFHGVFVLTPGKIIKFLKGFHTLMHPIDRSLQYINDLDNIHMAGTVEYENHPYCEFGDDVGIFYMRVLAELRVKFGGPKSSLPARIALRKKAAQRRLRLADIMNRDYASICVYLLKNLHEGDGLFFKDFIMKI